MKRKKRGSWGRKVSSSFLHPPLALPRSLTPSSPSIPLSLTLLLSPHHRRRRCARRQGEAAGVATGQCGGAGTRLGEPATDSPSFTSLCPPLVSPLRQRFEGAQRRADWRSPPSFPAMEDFAAAPPPARCPHCAGPLSKDMETSAWTVAPFIRDSFSMIGSAVGGTASAFYGFNHAMPIVRRWVKGPMWFHFLIGAPPVIVFSSACAGLAGGAVPALAQLASSSYHAAFSSSALGSSSQDDEMHKSRRSSPL